MKNNKTLLQTVQRLGKKELLRYASNIGMDPDENLSVSDLRQAYSDYILSNPKEILIRLPKGDLDIIERAKNAKSPADLYTLDIHLTPIMVLYGMADVEPPYEDAVGINIPNDLCKSLFPHIHWAQNDNNNHLRMSVEIGVEGLANIMGIVDQEEIRDLLKVMSGNNHEEEMQQLLNTVRHYSLLLDSMEWADDLATADDEDVLFVSRFGWENTAKMKKYIETHSSGISSMPELDVKDVALCSSSLIPVIPNERNDDFMDYLMSDLGFDKARAYLICFNLWYFKTRKGEYGEGEEALELYFLSHVLGGMTKDPTDEQAEEAMSRMADYVDHLPLWHLAGHTATEYPSERFVRTLTTKEPLGPMLRRMRKEAYRMADILNGKAAVKRAKSDACIGSPEREQARPKVKALLPEEPKPMTEPQNPWAGRNIGRNDPCPCGSGLKYKKCHGK